MIKEFPFMGSYSSIHTYTHPSMHPHKYNTYKYKIHTHTSMRNICTIATLAYLVLELLFCPKSITESEIYKVAYAILPVVGIQAA